MVRQILSYRFLVLVVVSLLLCGLVFAGSARASLMFSDGFESGNFNMWTSPVGTPTIVTNPVHSGNYAARFSFETSSCYQTKTIVPTKVLNYTHHIYFTSLPTNYLCVVLAQDTFHREVHYRVQHVDGTYKWIFDGGTGEIANANIPEVKTGQWYKIQFLAITGSNSTLHFLVNDQLLATITNRNLGPISELRVGNDWIDFGSYMPEGETYFDGVKATDNIRFFINAFAGDGGSITPNGAVNVDLHNNQTFNITPSANHHIIDVLVDGLSVGPVSNYTFNNVQTIHSIHATFGIDLATVTPPADSDEENQMLSLTIIIIAVLIIAGTASILFKLSKRIR